MRRILLFCLPLLGLTACELAFMDAEPSTRPQAIFDEAWAFADREYSFFEFKGIDWDAQYAEYAPRVKDDMDQAELFDLIAEMLYELRDGHVNLTSLFDRSRNWRWFLDDPPNYDYNLLERSYFKEEQEYAGPFILYDFGDVGYVHYRSFSSAVTEGRMTYVLNRFQDHDGLIIDVRDNGGGSLNNAVRIANRFTTAPVLVARSRYRNGPEHDDFTAWEDITIEPYEPEEEIEDVIFHWTKPVVVLTNRSSYSASTSFTQYMRELPNVVTMGDWTGGGGGTPAYTELGNGWIMRVSNTQLVSPDGFNVEDGIPPDIPVDMLESDLDEGKDTILEEALALIRG